MKTRRVLVLTAIAAYGGAAGDVSWSVSVRPPRGYGFTLTDVPVNGQ